ncbi:MOSC domain-containing protein [Aneurinibacillus danicus]|jgi:MOSC domain-containing protein YiiM|uniref:MOSC domain-containing protein n=1 Tax=Aneurinibacillus danicus TaxID=267746 RepID=A0A511V626_9BACL|nr:MOSC domain-containing protein [Aneurinibacillus danicus]GEN34390.1 MOSC domain-containing protein [Aneurinibacillus danicus]
MSNHIVSLNVGKPRKHVYQGREIETGIHKTPLKDRIFLSLFNLEGDGQADLVHHGGIDKALCVYPYEHYAYWEQEIGQKLAYGAFGENLTTMGLSEAEVCIGDIFRFGEAIVQVSQPRQPCYKVAARYNIPDFPLRIQQTGFTGFYFRVLKEGWVSAAGPLHRLEKHSAGITVTFANQIKYHDKNNIEAIKTILDVPELSASWRASLEERIAKLK